VQENERCLVLAIKVATELQRAMPFGTYYEERGRQEVVTDWVLMAREARPARDRELMFAILAFEYRAGLVAANLNATAGRAKRLAVNATVWSPAAKVEPFSAPRIESVEKPGSS
jgi:hypothetical protein